MGFFGMLFWIAVLWLVLRAWRRSHRCVAIGPGDYAPIWERGRYRGYDISATRTKPGDRDQYIDSLETRVSELEERLDFTERLLASRRETT